MHAQVLETAGILSPDEHLALREALDAVQSEFGQADCPASDAEDLHTWVEQQLTERAGAAGRKIHTARSRNDQIATLLKLYVIDAGERLEAALRDVVRVACQQAAAWAALAFPLHTHQQYAAPGSAGFWVLRYATSFDRARRRLAIDVREWCRTCPLGSGAVAGSSIPIDRAAQASGLGFESPSSNALDATSTRDECLELLATATQIALHLQSFATDVIVFSQTALGWTRYPGEFATGSSMMPNKVNPDAMELLRGKSNAVTSAHAELVSILKGLPSGYNRDLQCVKPVVHGAAETLIELVGMVAPFLAVLDFDPERLAASCKQGNINATLRMEEKVQAGDTLREAHHAVADELAGDADGSTPLVDNPLERYRTAGSANPDDVRRVARELLSELG